MSLLDSISGMMTPTMLGGLGRTFGVPEDKLRGSMGGLSAMFMNELAGRADNRATMEQVSGLIHESPDEVDDVDRLVDAPIDHPMKQRGSKLLALATGGDLAGLTGLTSRFLGIGGSAATGILGSISALAMTSLRRLGRTTHLDASSLGTLLHSERATYRDAMPAALRRDVRGAIPTRRTSRAWWALLLIPLAALMIWSFRAGHRHAASRQAEEQLPSRPAAEAMRERQRMGPPPGERERQARPTGQRRLSSVPGSAEDQLLEQARSPGTATAPIPLDRVTFARGSATPEPAAASQLANVAKLLQGHRNASVTITTYPDPGGNRQANAQLAQARAEAVRKVLTDDGIDLTRIKIEPQSMAYSGPFPRMVAMQITGQP